MFLCAYVFGCFFTPNTLDDKYITKRSKEKKENKSLRLRVSAVKFFQLKYTCRENGKSEIMSLLYLYFLSVFRTS